MQLPEPFSFIFTWFAAVPFIFWLSQQFTNAIVKDFLILKVLQPLSFLIDGKDVHVWSKSNLTDI